MYSTFTNHETNRKHRAIRDRDGVLVDVQERPMAKSYRVVEPADVVDAFARQGRQARVISVGRSKWKKAVVVNELELCGGRAFTNEEYNGNISILCGHDGRTALRIVPQIVRGFCANEFSGMGASIPHTSKGIDEFLADPVNFAIAVMAHCETLMNRLESFRGILADDTTLRFWLRHGGHKVLSNKYERIRNHGYYSERLQDTEGYPVNTAWGILQTLSATRSPRLIKLASEALEAPEVGAGEFDSWLFQKLGGDLAACTN